MTKASAERSGASVSPASAARASSRYWQSSSSPASSSPTGPSTAQPRSARVFRDGRTYSYLLHQPTDPEEPRIAITQADVRAIQLGKAALYAGIRLLMDRFGVAGVDRIQLAGAFGSHIDVKYAMILGLLPDCELENVSSAGNAAGTGARIAPLNQQARDEVERVAKRVEETGAAV